MDISPANPSLSTMWAQGRFNGDMREFARAARDLGYTHVEINYTVAPDGVAELVKKDTIGVSSLHSPTPRLELRQGFYNSDLNLASLDEDERTQAVAYARTTIEWAAQAGARYVVVHLGGIGEEEMFPSEFRLRRLYDSGVRAGAEVESLRQEAYRQRREMASAYLAQARKSLDAIAAAAARHGVTVGLENRYHYHEIPSVDEMQMLLAQYPADVVGYWHDVGHAEVLGRLGLCDKYRWLNELRDRTVGSHLHDVDGIGDHRAPGQGDADWDHIASALPLQAARVFEINQHTPEDQVAAAVPFLRKLGILH